MATGSDRDAAVLAAVDDAAVLGRLVDLVSIPSVGGSPAEAEVSLRCADWLADLGLALDLWPLPLAELRADPQYPGEEVDRAEAWGLVGVGADDRADAAADQPSALVLQGHLDVVPPGEVGAWHHDPYAGLVADGRVVGRGACDMKGGVAALLGAVAAVRHSRVPLRRAFAVHLVVGEEDGGLGAFATLRRGHRGDACIIPEPTDLTLVTANAGALGFRIEVPGLATHGSTRYAGVSAVEGYVRIHHALARLERTRNETVEPLLRDLPIPYPLSVGVVRAGEWASSVPDLLVAEGRYGLRIEEEPDLARAELEGAVEAAVAGSSFWAEHPPRVRWTGGQFRGGHLPSGHVLRDLVGRAHADVTGSGHPVEAGAPYGSDLRLYAAAGVPTLHYGPGDVRRAHGPDESVPVDQVLTAARTLALCLVRACG